MCLKIMAVNKNKQIEKFITFFAVLFLAPTLASCGSTPKASTETSILELTQTACHNLPNLLNWANWTDIDKPWTTSLNAFGELSRQDPKYLSVSTAAAKIADTVGPFYDGTKESESVDAQVQVVNGFCSGIGTLTP